MSSSIEKAIERFKKTSKYSSEELDIDFALADSHVNRDLPVVARIDEQVMSQKDKISRPTSKPHYSFNYSALAKQGFLTPNSERTAVAEEYRSLKRPILMNAFGKGAVPVDRGNLVMVTSSIPGEGKTFTSFNLAMSMALERDKTVLLIDSDVLRASLTKLLGLQGRLGILDVLKDNKIDLRDVIVNTDLPNLSIVPAGQAERNSTELFASEEMERITADLSSRYADRVVLFDAPPLLATTEASVLSHLMGQILLVVEAGNTQQSAVIESLSQIERDKVIGLMLNKSRRSFKSEYYNGYGYYGQ